MLYRFFTILLFYFTRFKNERILQWKFLKINKEPKLKKLINRIKIINAINLNKLKFIHIKKII